MITQTTNGDETSCQLQLHSLIIK